MKLKLLLMISALLLSACDSKDVWMPEPQPWGEFSIHFETRPEAVRQGMNEFLIIVNREGRRHIPDLLVHIRTNQSKWRQAIPDGALGVYRRALPVGDIHVDQLHVRLRYHGKEGELTFALAPKVIITQ
ncbi:MAG: hypothetical protein Q9M16_06395 [Mariprofundus sp.]|nr:hypothetical protein [Mariprofundus sp.]